MPPLYFNIFVGLVFCSMILAAGRGFGETYNDGLVHNISTVMSENAVTVTNKTTLNWTYNGATYPLQGKTITVNGGATFYYNQAQEVLGSTSATFSGAGTVATLDYYTANSGGITINDGAVLNIYNNANNGYGALLGNGSGGINVTSGSGTLNLYAKGSTSTTPLYSYASLRNNVYPINIGTNATLTVNGSFYNTYNTTNPSSDLTKKGAGTLIVQHGSIGRSQATTNPCTFIIEAGKVQLANGAFIYYDSKTQKSATIQLASGTTMDIESTASASNSVTLDGKYLLNGTNTIESTSVNGSSNYGSFLFNGGWVGDETINVQTGTTTLTTPETSKGIRMRGQYSGFDVAANATLMVNSNITYDGGQGENDLSVSSGIYKTGAGTMNLARGTVTHTCQLKR